MRTHQSVVDCRASVRSNSKVSGLCQL